jgi:pimeloyl-ACP methyl ester carboxylesterase
LALQINTINHGNQRYLFMRQFVNYILLTVLGLVFLSGCQAQKASIRGPQGEIAYKITLPDGFDPTTDQCPMVILMHGIFSSKDFIPMPQLAKGLAKAGIASIRFDFGGHGKSEGRKQDMTIGKELADARAVWDYVQSLPYVNGVGLLGHSQGGVVASMAAGRLASESTVPLGVVLIAPGSVIKEACQGGKFFNARFDPKDPPEYIRCWGLYKLGREYLVTTQQLDIYGTAAAYQGPVLLLHGDRDGIVPMWCSERYLEAYGPHATLKVVEGENHTITRRRKQVVAETVEFFRGVFGR